MSRWEDLARNLGGSHRVEPTPGGKAEVVFGALEGFDYTVFGLPDGSVLVEVDFAPGQDEARAARRVLEDEELRRLVAAARASPLGDQRLRVQADCAWVVWNVGEARPVVPELAPVVRRLGEVLAEEAPGYDHLCRSCSALEAALARPFGATTRLCDPCLEVLREEQNRLAALEGEMASLSEDERPPFPVPEEISAVEMDRQSRQLQQDHDRDPARYRGSLMGLVALGQAALAASAVAVAALLALGVGLAALLVSTGGGLLLLLKLLVVKGAKLVLVGLVVMGGLLAGLWNSIVAAFRRPPVHELEGVRLERAEAPRLYQWLDDLAREVDAPPADLVLLYRNCNCAAAELRDGRRGFRRVVQIGLPILEMFDREELRSVMAHELGHLRHGDSRAAWIYRTATSWMDLSWRLQEVPEAGLLGRFANWYVPRFFLRAQVVMRQAEHEADRRAAAAVDPAVCARSLVKVSVLSHLFGEALGRGFRRRGLAGAAGEPDPVALTREGVAALPPAAIRKALKATLEEEPSWLDTHPVLSERLRVLGVPPPSEVDLDLSPAHPATDLLDDYPALRKRVMGALPESMEIQLHREVREVQACRRRLEGDRPEEAAALVRKARDLSRLDRDEEALEAYDGALALQPEHAAAARERIQVLLRLDRLPEAAAGWRDLLASHPEDVGMNLHASVVFREAGMPEEAAGCLRTVLKGEVPKPIREALEEQLRKLQAPPSA